jgi:hypothetical protein
LFITSVPVLEHVIAVTLDPPVAVALFIVSEPLEIDATAPVVGVSVVPALSVAVVVEPETATRVPVEPTLSINVVPIVVEDPPESVTATIFLPPPLNVDPVTVSVPPVT